MNEAVRFTREVIAMAKERGLSCMVMADGAYAFTGDLPHIMGEHNGMLNEKGWVETENAKNYTFNDLCDYIMDVDTPDSETIVGCNERTAMEIELDTEFFVSVDPEDQSLKVYQKLHNAVEGEEYDQVLQINFFRDPVQGKCWIYQVTPDGVQKNCRIIRDLSEKLSKTIIPDMPTYISAALMKFLMHLIYCWKIDSKKEK